MGCYSRNFTISVLQEKPYFKRISNFLIEQIVELPCDDLSWFFRAIDAIEKGEPITKVPRNDGKFNPNGVLAGYSHFHFKRADWLASNLALSVKLPINLPLDEIIDTIAGRILDGNQPIHIGIESAADQLRARITTEATGDWVIFKETPNGRIYLAIHEHTKRGSKEEHDLKNLLDSFKT